MAGVWVLFGKDMKDAKDAVDEFADNKSARVVAILGSSTLDEMLRRALAYRFIESSVADDVFKPAGGALGTMHAKIQIGYLLGMYGKPERKALVGISEIRNRFAHKLTVHTFEDEALKDGFDKLELHNHYSKFPDPFQEGDSEHLVEPPKDRRATFITNLQLLLVILMRDYQRHFAHSNYAKPIGKLPRDYPLPPGYKP
jgi:hypothetical protein